MQRYWGAVLWLAVLVIFLLSFLIGRYQVDPLTVLRVFASQALPLPSGSPIVRSVVLDVRLPRIAAAMLVGAGLSLSGACYQGVFRNPLVSEFTLGVSAGAGFGAALAILYFFVPGSVQASAFVFGLAAVGLCYLLGQSFQSSSTLILVLLGVIVSALFTALLSLLKYTADPDGKLPLIEFWLLGSLARASRQDLWTLLAIFVPCAAILLQLSWRLNLLTLGDEEARSLGVNVGLLRSVVILAATLIAASTVAAGGIIGWVGLVVPHAARILVGPDFRRILPAATALGACYLMLADDLARTITQAELPLGVLTALVGAPFFALLLRQQRLGWT